MTQSVAQEAALSAEQTAREELAGVLGQQRVEAMREKEGLLMQVTLDLIGFLLLKIYIHTYIYTYKRELTALHD